MEGKVISIMESERYGLEFLEEYDLVESYESHYKIRHKDNTYSIKSKEFLIEQTEELDYGGVVVEAELNEKGDKGELTSVLITLEKETFEIPINTYEGFQMFEATLRGFVGMGYPIKVVK